MGEEELWLQVRQAIKANMMLGSRVEPYWWKGRNDSNLKLENKLKMTYLYIYIYKYYICKTWINMPSL